MPTGAWGGVGVGEAVPVVKSQEIVKVLILSGEPSAGWSWHESGRRGGPV